MWGRRPVLAVAACVTLAAGVALNPATGADAGSHPLRPPVLTALHAGHPMLRVTPINVNVVTIGYPRGSIDTARLVSRLPVDGVPAEVYPALRGLGYAAGDEFQYHYRTVNAGRSFEDEFFTHLARTGTVGPPDAYQAMYDAEAHHSLDVGPKVRFIDAKETERWLEEKAGDELDLNPRDYTVFLVDWYGRRDFQFHTYTNRSNPDPDTGTDARVTLSQTHVRAWGGTSGPTWFFDVSAGPVYTDGSFNVDDADINHTGTTDFRVPPVWDYGHVGYRAFDDLTADLAKTVRYVAIDELFAAAPLFDPLATQPLPGNGKLVALDVFQGDPAHDGLALIHPDIVQTQLRRLQPYTSISMSVRGLPLVGGALNAYEIGTFSSSAPGCWNDYGYPDAELVCYFLGNFASYFPTSTPDVVVPEVGFTVGDDPSRRVGFRGVTDDDFATGAPRLISMFDDAPLRALPDSYAYTLMSMHETGHFLGLAHPHDGEDPEQHAIFGPDSEYFEAWTGDQSDSVMSYLPGNLSFDTFDFDNLARSLYARESTAADYWAGVLLAGPPDADIYAQLAAADRQFRSADKAVSAERWLDAGGYADTGFLDVERALQIGGILPSGTSSGTSSATSHARVKDSRTVLTSSPHVTGSEAPRPFSLPRHQRRCVADDFCTPAIAGRGR